MELETRAFPLKIKSLSPEGSFMGLGSTYGNIDLVGDTIMPGAYKQAIASQGQGYPLLWVHDQQCPLGIAKISDSTDGLVVNGQMNMEDANAKRILSYMKMGTVRGLSIGFQHPDPAKTSYTPEGTRILREIRLFEMSLCPVPADQHALVQSVKSLGQVEHLLHSMRGKAADAEMLEHLKAIHGHVLSLLADAGEDVDDPEEEDEDGKALLLQLKSFAGQVQELARA